MTNLSLMLSMLEDNQTLKISPEGSSMCPFFFGGRDDVYLKQPHFPLKRGDIALFQREDGKQVIHRIHHLGKNADKRFYYMIGDNQTWIEGPIAEDEILAKATQIMRKGKLIDCQSNRLYRLTVAIWLILRPFRPKIMHLWSKLHR